MALFGLLGYVFRKLGCEPAPMLLGFILGPDDGGVSAPRPGAVGGPARPFCCTEPLSAFLLAAAALLLGSVLLPAIRKKREQTFVSEG